MYLFFLFRKSKLCLVDRSSNFQDLLPQIKDGEWTNFNPRCFDLNKNLTEFSCPVTIFPLIHFSYVLTGERMVNGQQIWLVDRSSNVFNLLPHLKDGEWFSCCPRCFVSYQNLPEVWYPNVFHSLICFSKVLSEEMLHELSTYLVCYHSSSKNRVISPDPSSEGIVSQWM